MITPTEEWVDNSPVAESIRQVGRFIAKYWWILLLVMIKVGHSAGWAG